MDESGSYGPGMAVLWIGLMNCVCGAYGVMLAD